MTDFLQNALAWLLVAAAATYLLYTNLRWWLRKPSGDCGGCHGCAKTSAAPTNLVSLETKPAGTTMPER